MCVNYSYEMHNAHGMCSITILHLLYADFERHAAAYGTGYCLIPSLVEPCFSHGMMCTYGGVGFAVPYRELQARYSTVLCSTVAVPILCG